MAGAVRKISRKNSQILRFLHNGSEFARQTLCIILKLNSVNGTAHTSTECSHSVKTTFFSVPEVNFFTDEKKWILDLWPTKMMSDDEWILTLCSSDSPKLWASWQSSSARYSNGRYKVLVQFHWVQLELLDRWVELVSALYLFLKPWCRKQSSSWSHTFKKKSYLLLFPLERTFEKSF